MIDIPHKDNSSGKKLNDHEFVEFNKEVDGTIDQPYGITHINSK